MTSRHPEREEDEAWDAFFRGNLRPETVAAIESDPLYCEWSKDQIIKYLFKVIEKLDDSQT